MDSPHLGDEILTAVIDDDPAAPADAAARQHVEACAPCQARLAQLRHVVAAIGRPPEPASSALRETHLRVALSAGTVRPIETARRLRTRPLVLAAAASILVLLSAGGLVVALRGGSGSRSKETVAASLSHPSVTGGFRGAAGTLPSSAGALNALGPIAADYGDQSDLGTLSTLIANSLQNPGPVTPIPRAAAPGSSANALAAPGAGPDCEPAAQADADRVGAGAAPALTATLRWDSQPARAVAFRLGGGNLLIEVRRQSDCFLLASRTT
jgi:hypothetical protein